MGLPSPGAVLVRRHAWPVRLTHWINALCLVILFMSGLGIFNAHPALYWGENSHFDLPLLSMTAGQSATGAVKGYTWIKGMPIDTTGVLGASQEDGQWVARGFPAWATLPGPQWLAMARQWHFAFAWLLVFNAAAYLIHAALSGHIRRDLLPSLREIAHLPREIVSHIRLRFPKGEEARRYNGLQKIAYVTVIFVLGPLAVATGLTMSPTMNAAFPFLLDLFGGRQSARTIHFLCAFGFVAFFLVHIAMVLLSGVWNNLRGMITGRYAIEREPDRDA